VGPPGAMRLRGRAFPQMQAAEVRQAGLARRHWR